MELTFTNGSDQQQSLWREALHKLLHLPFDELPLGVTITFVDPASLGGKQTTLAETTWTYGSNESTTQVRNDAPGFAGAPDLVALAASMGLTYDATKHFHETAAHETGHSAFAALPEENRIAIAQMFGASSDSVEELFPESKAWEDRPGEAIAETFKEAFLPRRYRVFPNRTNIHIGYDKFPEFRRLFRVARTVKEEKVIEPNEPFPAGAKGSTIGYRFPFAGPPFFFEYPVKTKPPVDVRFQAWEVRFAWSFKKWFTNKAGGEKQDLSFMVVELIDVFDEDFFSGIYFGTQEWYFATAEKPAHFHFENSFITLFDEEGLQAAGRWKILPELPEPFILSGSQLNIHTGGLWVPPTTFGEDFTVPADDLYFHWEGSSFVYCGTRVAAGQLPSSFPAIFKGAYPNFMLDGADLFRMGGLEPPETPTAGNKGIEGYRQNALEPSPPEEVLERASVYQGNFSLPTKQIIIPGEEEDRDITAPGGQIEPTGANSGRHPALAS